LSPPRARRLLSFILEGTSTMNGTSPLKKQARVKSDDNKIDGSFSSVRPPTPPPRTARGFFSPHHLFFPFLSSHSEHTLATRASSLSLFPTLERDDVKVLDIVLPVSSPRLRKKQDSSSSSPPAPPATTRARTPKEQEEDMPLQGCVVFVSATGGGGGEGPDRNPLLELNCKLAALGATLAPTLTSDVTHVVFNGAEQQQQQQQQQEELMRELYDRAGDVFPLPPAPAPIVSRGWVLACEREGRRAMERPFICAKPTPTPTPTTATTATPTTTAALLLGMLRFACGTPRVVLDRLWYFAWYFATWYFATSTLLLRCFCARLLLLLRYVRSFIRWLITATAPAPAAAASPLVTVVPQPLPGGVLLGLHQQQRTAGQNAIAEVLESRDLLERVLSFLPTPGDVARCAAVNRAFRIACVSEAVWGPHLAVGLALIPRCVAVKTQSIDDTQYGTYFTMRCSQNTIN
jgi:hypothetical protein